MGFPDAEAFERAGLKAWPGIEEHWDRSWVRRAAGGYTKRANCTQCFDPDDFEDADVRVISAASWMVLRKIKPVFRITPLSSPELNATLDEAGWTVLDPSHLFAMELGEQEADPEARVLPVLDAQFLAAAQRLQGYDATAMSGMKNLLAALKVPAAGVLLYRNGQAVASSIMAVADGIVVTGNVVTDPARRRQGLAAAMMRSGLSWARGQGARYAALNVQADNAAAKALYSALGYVHQYDYSYRIPGAPK
ncbi:GNAT family N-acetyltransferase [Devosia sp. PTR5]|jgi:GNAT superfamily N-acetyltransferase|uniref:GNAT family N-acetyltransferase n=1 Tax=Devosia oryzisoli TaxID=2774138 RepID=A0A927FY36_9HYPH|nr:GNAT family N-acetyltransferase [Devosia oryzisoli]MBD8067058.1 GNAT family N-acetyltransferase [Devosia oryzisoli]